MEINIVDMRNAYAMTGPYARHHASLYNAIRFIFKREAIRHGETKCKIAVILSGQGGFKKEFNKIILTRTSNNNLDSMMQA